MTGYISYMQVILNADYLGSACFVLFIVLVNIPLLAFIKNRKNESAAVSKLCWNQIIAYVWLYVSLVLIYAYSTTGSKIGLTTSGYFFYGAFLVHLAFNDLFFKASHYNENKILYNPRIL